MTLETIYYIGQTIAVFAILVSLIALWVQRRQTYSVEKSNAQRQLLDGCRSFFWSLSHDQALFEDVRYCLHRYGEADDFQKQRFSGWAFDILMMTEQAFYQHREKLINEAQFNGFTTGMIKVINTAGGRVWWEEARQLVSADFSKFLHGRYERDGASVPRWDEIQSHLRLPAGHDTGLQGSAP